MTSALLALALLGGLASTTSGFEAASGACTADAEGATGECDSDTPSLMQQAGLSVTTAGSRQASSDGLTRWTPTMPACTSATRCDVYVSDSLGQDKSSAGDSPENPYKTIAYAVGKRITGQTIHIMAGTYRNKGFGTGELNNGPVVRLNGVTNLKITNYQDHKPLIEFDGQGGFLGGSKSQPVEYLEISGLEISGPSGDITYQEAMDNRLTGDDYFSGRGIAVWAGHHIYIHDMVVHHCPNSGIRVNKGDYVIVENSEVFSNTWWSPNAESAIVYATSAHIDEQDIVKMIIRNNQVYDNVNKVPYYNKKYTWDYSPIGSTDCSKQTACEQELATCPWTCRYGKKIQDYIIDGQGVYVTRNKDTYLHGRMELSGNICYGNGINGLVFHRTNRGIVKDNVVFDNGVVPKDGHPESQPEDWHACCPGKGRQPYSGLILNEAEDVEVLNNSAAARYEDDYAFKMQMDHGSAYPVTGGKNLVCSGEGELDPISALAKPKRCSDNPSAWMKKNGKECATLGGGLQKYCNKDDKWKAERNCELSCFKAGNGYDGDNCCILDDVASDYMKGKGLECETWAWGLQKNCNKNAEWTAAGYCRLSCFMSGVGYEGDDCCALMSRYSS